MGFFVEVAILYQFEHTTILAIENLYKTKDKLKMKLSNQNLV